GAYDPCPHSVGQLAHPDVSSADEFDQHALARVSPVRPRGHLARWHRAVLGQSQGAPPPAPWPRLAGVCPCTRCRAVGLARPTQAGALVLPPGARLRNALLSTRTAVRGPAETASGELAGFVQLFPSFSSVSAARIYVLNDLFVAPAHRRQGVARRLLEAAHRVGSDGGAVYLALSTARDNRPAQALCESLGWVRDEAFHQYTLATGATSAGLARRPRPEDSWRHGSGRRVMAGRTWGAYFSVVTVVLLVLGVVA